MKTSKFFEMTDAELNVQLTSLKEELFNLRFQHKAGQLTNPMKIATCKKDIARVYTILSQRAKLNASQPANSADKAAK